MPRWRWKWKIWVKLISLCGRPLALLASLYGRKNICLWLLLESVAPKRAIFFLSKRELLPITSSLTCANYWQHPLQMSYVFGAFSCSSKPCSSINQFILCVGPCLISTKNTASDRAKNFQPDWGLAIPVVFFTNWMCSLPWSALLSD